MDTQHREIRAQLSAMAPRRAIAYIRSFDLPPDEAASLIECDVRGRSCVQAAELLHLSVDGLAKLRRRAYRKIADGQTRAPTNRRRSFLWARQFAGRTRAVLKPETAVR